MANAFAHAAGQSSGGGKTQNAFLSALGRYHDQQEFLAGLGQEVPETGAGTTPIGLLSGLLSLLDRGKSAVVGGISGVVGEDHSQSGNVNETGSLGEGLSRAWEGFTGTDFGTGDFAALQMNEDDSFLGKVGKGAAAFTLDTLSDPLTYLTLGTGALGKIGVKAVAGVGEQLLTNAGKDAAEAATKTLAQRANDAAIAGVARNTGGELPEAVAARLARPAQKQAAEQLDAELGAALAERGTAGVRAQLIETFGEVEGQRLFNEVLPDMLRGGVRVGKPLGIGGPGYRVGGRGGNAALEGFTSAYNTGRTRLRASAAGRTVLDNIGKTSKEYGNVASTIADKGATQAQKVNAVREFLASEATRTTLEQEARLLHRASISPLGAINQATQALASKEEKQAFIDRVDYYYLNPMERTAATSPADQQAAQIAQRMADQNYATFTAAEKAAGNEAGGVAREEYAPRIVTPEAEEFLARTTNAKIKKTISDDPAGHSRNELFIRPDGTQMGVQEANEVARKELGIDFDFFETNGLKAYARYEQAWQRLAGRRRAKQLLVENGILLDAEVGTNAVDRAAVASGLKKLDKLTEQAAKRAEGERNRALKKIANAKSAVQELELRKAALEAEATGRQVQVNAPLEQRRLAAAEAAGRKGTLAEQQQGVVDDRLVTLDDRLATQRDLYYNATTPEVAETIDNRLFQGEAVLADPATTDAITYRPAADVVAAEKRRQQLADAEAAARQFVADNPARVTAGSVASRDAAQRQLGTVNKDLAKAKARLAKWEATHARIEAALPSLVRSDYSTIADKIATDPRAVTADEMSNLIKNLTQVPDGVRAALDAAGVKVGGLVKIPAGDDLLRDSSVVSEFGQGLDAAGYRQLRDGFDNGAAALFATANGLTIAEAYLKAATPEGGREWARMLDAVYMPYYSLFKQSATIGRGMGYHIRNITGAAWNNWMVGVTPRETTQSWRVTNAYYKHLSDGMSQGLAGSDLDTFIDGKMKKQLSGMQVNNRLNGYQLFRAMADNDLFHARNVLSDVGDTGQFAGDMLAETLGASRSRLGARIQSDRRNITPYVSREDQMSLTLRGEKGVLRNKATTAARLANAVANNPYYRTSQRLAEASEAAMRGAALARGFDLFNGSAAAARTMMMYTQFDYSDLSDMERTITKKFIPFYTWSRNNVPFQLREMMRNPGRYAMLPRLQEFMADISATEEEQAAFEQYTPQWVRDKFGWITPFNPTGAGPIAAMIDVPAGDLNTLLQSSAMPIRWESAVGQLNPAIKSIIESTAGFNSQTGEKFDPKGTPAPKWAQYLRLTHTDSDGRTVMSEGWKRAATNNIPPLNLLEKLTGMQPVEALQIGATTDAERAASNFGSIFLGASTATMTEKQKSGELRARSDRLAAQLDAAIGELGIDKEWLESKRRRGMSEAAIARLIAMGQGRLRGGQ